MKRTETSGLTLQMIVVSAACGAGVTEMVEGVWSNDPVKILVGAAFAGLAALFVNVLENLLLDRINRPQ